MADALWRDVEGQLLWALVAVGGALILPGRSLVDRLGLGPGRLGLVRVALALAGFLALSNGVHRAILALGLFDGSTLAEIDRVVREASPVQPWLVLLAIGLVAKNCKTMFRGGQAGPAARGL